MSRRGVDARSSENPIETEDSDVSELDANRELPATLDIAGILAWGEGYAGVLE
jgi:hypothetical protein